MMYRSGGFYRVCDVCGGNFRASETRKRWDGLWVCTPDFETRHQQDFVRGQQDRIRVPEPRPVPSDVWVAGVPYPITLAGDFVTGRDFESFLVL